MTICRKTSFDELYTVLCRLVTVVTAVPCWRKIGIQAQPNGAYATVYLTEGGSPTQDVVEDSESANGLSQSPVGLIRLDCKVEFFRNVISQPALVAATRLRNSLQLESRFRDLWTIAGLVGEIRTIDVSAMFRADVEGRAEVRFSLYADVSSDYLPDSTDMLISNIESQGITVFRTATNTTPVSTIDVPRR